MGSARGESAGSKVGCLFQFHGLRPPQALLKGFLRGFPAGFQLLQQPLSLGGERPPTLPTVITDRIACKPRFLDQRQHSRGRGLINAKALRHLRRGQVWGQIQKLQRRELRGMKAAVAEHFLVQHGYCPGGLPEGRAVAR